MEGCSWLTAPERKTRQRAQAAEPGPGAGAFLKPNLAPARSFRTQGKRCGASTPRVSHLSELERDIPDSQTPGAPKISQSGYCGSMRTVPVLWAARDLLLFHREQSKPNPFTQKQPSELRSCFGFFKVFPVVPGWEGAFKFSFSFCSKTKTFSCSCSPSKNLIYFANPP